MTGLMSEEHLDESMPKLLRACQFSHPERYARNFNKYSALLGAGAADAKYFARGLESQGNDMARFYVFCLISDLVAKERISGDVAELGVWQGNTAELLAMFARRQNRTLYLLDTFEGLPAADLNADDKHLVGTFQDTDIETVRKRVGSEGTVLIKGYFPETASQLPLDAKFSIVHIDCDLYAPMIAALQYFYPRMTPGGFIIVHDYLSLFWDGVERAVDEFLVDKPESIFPVPDLAGTVVIRKNKF
jgi:O-methyltransferase